MAFAESGEWEILNSGAGRRDLFARRRSGDGGSMQVVIGVVIIRHNAIATARLEITRNVSGKRIGSNGSGLYCCAQQYRLKD